MKFIKTPIKIALLTLILTGCASQSIDEQAQSGNVNAQYLLAKKSEKNKDYINAFNWYQKAANAGDAKSMHDLGYLYQTGKGTPKNESKAFDWYAKSAENGNSNAMYRVANAYRRGILSVSKDPKKAEYWFNKSLKADNDFLRNAFLTLGIMNKKGETGTVNNSKAVNYLLKAIKLPLQDLEGFEAFEQDTDIELAKSIVKEIYSSNREYYNNQLIVSSYIQDILGRPTRFFKIAFEPSSNNPIILTDIKFNNGNCNVYPPLSNKKKHDPYLWQQYNYGQEITLDQGDCLNIYKIEFDTLNYGPIKVTQ
ncbi:tetratricopeptide repeat protein [Photobacterium angustum]|uniref:Sel1 repeat family protein n=1 Tax=Photobacterium angustum TaxID=661 RepID=A0ABX5H165_PHOAN|nr:tetratricopeptide repeat protein [Photobacterium angustum]PSX07039.1 sel1 repeat family protein [Photobacterium angustum]